MASSPQSASLHLSQPEAEPQETVERLLAERKPVFPCLVVHVLHHDTTQWMWSELAAPLRKRLESLAEQHKVNDETLRLPERTDQRGKGFDFCLAWLVEA